MAATAQMMATEIRSRRARRGNGKQQHAVFPASSIPTCSPVKQDGAVSELLKEVTLDPQTKKQKDLLQGPGKLVNENFKEPKAVALKKTADPDPEPDLNSEDWLANLRMPSEKDMRDAEKWKAKLQKVRKLLAWEEIPLSFFIDGVVSDVNLEEDEEVPFRKLSHLKYRLVQQRRLEHRVKKNQRRGELTPKEIRKMADPPRQRKPKEGSNAMHCFDAFFDWLYGAVW